MTSGDTSVLQPLAKFLVELPPRIRWHVGALRTKALRPAFADIGNRSVIVAPHKLRGVERISMGEGCSVFEGAWLEAEPGAYLHLENRVYLGRNVHVHAVDDVFIGSGTMIADNVLINSGEHVIDDEMSVRGTGTITIGAGCFIGVDAVIFSGVKIGDGATVGAKAVVTQDVPAGATVVGIPARIIS